MIGYPQGWIDYTSTGQIRMLPELPKLMYANEENGPIAMFDAYLDAEASTIRSQRTIDLALQDLEWKTWKWPPPDDFASNIGQTLHVSHSGEILNISATGPDPKAEMLTVRTVVRAYKQLFQEQNIEADTARNDLLDQRQTQLRSDVSSYKAQILNLARKNPYGTQDLTQFYNDKLKQLENIQTYLQQAKMAEAQNTPVPAIVPADEERLLSTIAHADPRMAVALEQRDAWASVVDGYVDSKIDEKDASLLNARTILAATNRVIQKYKAEYQQAHPPDASDAAAVLTVGAAAPATQPAEDAVARLEAASAQCNAKLHAIALARLDISEIEEKLANAQQKLQETTRRIESLQVESSYNVTGRLRVISDGALPTEPSSDTHIAMAAAGGGAGLLLSVILAGFRALRNHRKTHLSPG